MAPAIRYARSGDVHVAYHVFGEGPLNVVLAPFFVSNIEVLWESPDFARWMLRLGSYARVAMFDKRGTGMSDRVSELPGLDQRIDDFRAVMDAAGMGGGRFSVYLKVVPWQRFSLPHIPTVVGISSLWQLLAFHFLVPDRGGIAEVSRLCRSGMGKRHHLSLLCAFPCERSGSHTMVRPV